MRVLMTGGGTGGHVNPAIAIANKIKSREPDSVIAFVGTSRGIENKLVPREGYELFHVEVQGIRRSFSPKNIKSLWLAYTSIGKAKKLIRTFKPDLVVGTGGYVSWPVVKAASQMGIPTALHESNALPGFAVKMLENSADRLYVNFEETKKHLKHPERALRVGNPLKGEFKSLSYENARETLGISGKYRRLILSCGGSMGAERINDEVLDMMKTFSSKHPEILHIHATGSLEYSAARVKFEQMGLDKFSNLEFTEYIYDMPQKMAAADLVINRAGAITISELAIMKKPCILIPSPNVTDNHQYKNAKVISDGGGAVMIEESTLNAGLLAAETEKILSSREKMKAMSDGIAAFAVENAGDIIYDDLNRLVHK